MDADPRAESAHISDKQRNLNSQKYRVLSRKAVERTHLLEAASRHMIDTSKALVYESKRRTRSAAQTLSRGRAVKARETFERRAA